MNNSVNNRKALGRGLEALLPTAATPAAEGVQMLSLAAIVPNPAQPRRAFDAESLNDLAQSIRAQGLLQPVLVRRTPTGYQIIAGERRYHASRLAGLESIPALVRDYDDRRALEAAVVENLQREDLNPLEQARGFADLAQRFHLTQEQIAEKTGKDRASVANYIRLLKLDPEVQTLVESRQLSMGHARALLPLDLAVQRSLAAAALAQGWNVRQTEARVQAVQDPRPPAPAKPRDPNVRDAESQLTRALGAKVRIKGGKKAGLVEIAFTGLDDFQRLFDRLIGD